MEDNNRQSIILYTKLSCIFVSIIKKWKVILLISLMCGVSLDVVKTLTYKPKYASTITAYLSSEENSYSQLENAVGYIHTLSYIFNSEIVENYIKEQMQLDNLDINCQINSVNNTNIIRVQVYSSSKAQAYYSLNYMEKWYQNNKEKYQI